MNANPELKHTALYDFHVEHGAKMVPFAGYAMPVQYPMGVLGEHLHTREAAGLFDVSHMGQAFLIAEDGQFATAAKFLETLVPCDVLGLEPGQQRYTQLLNPDGGIRDDLMVTRLGLEPHQHWLYLVVNAACKSDDYAYIEAHLPDGISLRTMDDMQLIALQGPKASAVMGEYAPALTTMPFMTSLDLELHNGIWAHVSRSGYTGEDGYEIALKKDDTVPFVTELMRHEAVAMIGLGARDSLRLEAGLCLYGHDIDTSTSPVEAGLSWSIQARRREEGGFAGFERIQRELAEKPSRRRVGIQPLGRAPAREGTRIQSEDGQDIGTITSGGFGPSVGGPVAMGSVRQQYAKIGTPLSLIVRGRSISAKVVKLPFVAANFYRG